MAKRLNPHRRLLAKQASVLNDARLQQSAAHSAEMKMLQQGAIRSSAAISLNPSSKGPSVAQLTRLQAPRPAPWETKGVLGKVVRGKLVPRNPEHKARFAEPTRAPLTLAERDAVTAGADTGYPRALVKANRIASNIQERKRG